MRFLIPILLTAAFGQQPDPVPQKRTSTDQWRIKFFHDENESAIDFQDLVAPAPGTVYAFGVLSEERRSPRGVMVASRDNGKTFETVKLPDLPVSAHFLDAQHGWLVTDNAVQRTLDGGLTWKRVSKLRGVLRVSFLDPQRGFAIGYPKAIWSTVDGGMKWNKVPEAKVPKTRDEYTTYSTLVFRDATHGLITGHSRPPRRDASPVPAWMDPQAQKPMIPNLLIVLETNDGGLTWKEQMVSMFGQVAKIAFSKPTAPGLALIEYSGGFEYASELVNLLKTQSAFRSKTRAVTDFTYDSSGRVWAAAVAVPGKLSHLPVPSKVEVLESSDLEHWYTVPVDYKAVANRVKIAFAGSQGWLATDGGMILALEPK